MLRVLLGFFNVGSAFAGACLLVGHSVRCAAAGRFIAMAQPVFVSCLCANSLSMFVMILQSKAAYSTVRVLASGP